MPSKPRILTKLRVTIHTSCQWSAPRSLLPPSSPAQPPVAHRVQCQDPGGAQQLHGQVVLQQRGGGGGRVQPAGAAGRRRHRAGVHAPLHAAQEALRHHLPLLLIESLSRFQRFMAEQSRPDRHRFLSFHFLK
ncbi:hypothetical protein BAE44_0004739 [Dichanthelium oligosanthes]|uniref:Uncharacterized protein n=1 Tax=Dichanthelium oligosanthes TaxID=888268 RepID=A0A1E5WA15_9POAL|nr:hypothetical protein BAE44_0004739 [Dichanthelium oligosanthes]